MDKEFYKELVQEFDWENVTKFDKALSNLINEHSESGLHATEAASALAWKSIDVAFKCAPSWSEAKDFLKHCMEYSVETFQQAKLKE